MKRMAIALLACLAAAATACNGGGGTGPSPTGGQTLSPGQLPTSSPGAATGNVSRGEASVQVAGDLEAEFSAPLAAPTAYAPPPGGFALRWVKGTNGVGIAGLTFTGTRPTSSELSIVITIGSGNSTVFFRSSNHECHVTIDTAQQNEVAGNFTCAGLKSANGKETVDASGRFSASG
jgi:hypothetical protein